MSRPARHYGEMGDPLSRKAEEPAMGDRQKMGDPPNNRAPCDPNTRGPCDPNTRGPCDQPNTRDQCDPPNTGPQCDPNTRAPCDPNTRAPCDPPNTGPQCDPLNRPQPDPNVRVLTDKQALKIGEPQIHAVADPLIDVARVLLRLLIILIPVYVIGRLGFSVAWLLFGIFLFIFWNRNKSGKMSRLRAAWELLEDESRQVTQGLNSQQLPAWVTFPEMDRVEWVNKILKQMWPYFGLYMEKFFQEKIEAKVRASNVHLKAFTFTKLNFGEKPPRVNGIKAYNMRVDKREVILDMQICYTGDCEINVEVKKLWKAGVKGLQIHGTLRVILAPLMSDIPFVGAVTFFFIQKPFLDINWTGITNLLEIPGVSDMSDGMIVDLIASYLVLPNRFTYPLCSKVNPAQLRFPIPHGVLRVYLYEAENLIPKDTYLRGLIKGKSDPYAVLRVGIQTFKSKTIRENLNPKWHEMYEFVVHEVPGQDLEIDLYDEDPDRDDFLGSLVIGLEGVMKDRIVDEWFPLNNVATGCVRLKLEWYSLLANQEKLCQAHNGLSVAMVIVYLDSAGCLPKNHLEYSSSEYTANRIRDGYGAYPLWEREPSSYVVMNVGKKTVKSKTCSTTINPVWDQAFSFFCQDVYTQHLLLEVKDNDRQCALGMLDFPLHQILEMKDLVADQRFPLSNSGPNSFVKMKVVLRVLHIEDPDPDRVYAGLNSLRHGPVSIRRKPQDKPQGKPQNAPDSRKPSMHHAPPPNTGHVVPPSSTGHPAQPAPSTGHLAPPPQNTGHPAHNQASTGHLAPPPQNTGHLAPQPPSIGHLTPPTPSTGHLAPPLQNTGHRAPPSQSTGHLAPPSNVIRRGSSVASSRSAIQNASEEGPPFPQANQSPGNSAASSAQHTPKLRHLQRIAPSLISLNSVASSVFDPNDDLHSGLQLGEINISVRYASLRRCLLVSINGCRNLLQCSNHGADPYVRIYLLPDRRWASRKKTSIKKKTLNPIYNERFEFLVSLEDAKKRILDIAVKNNRPFGSHERKEMGKTLIYLSQLDVDQGITDWFELTATGHPTS